MDPHDKNRQLIQRVLAELFPPEDEEDAGAPAYEAPNALSAPAAKPAGSSEAVRRRPARRAAPVGAPVTAAQSAAARSSGQARKNKKTGGPSRRASSALKKGRMVAVVNQKGGVGKTTSTNNLGAALAEEGARVLLVDFDPQGALSVGLGLNPNAMDTTVYNLLLDRSVSLDEVVVPSRIEGLDLIPSNIDLSAAEVMLVNEVAREQLLKRALAPAQGSYNYILIDCPPSLGLLTVNALTAAAAVLIPLECEYFALRGMALLMDTVAKVKERLNPDLEVLGIVATMLEARTIHGREVLSRVSDAFGDKLFKTIIHKTIKFSEAPVAGEPILSYAPSSNGAQEYRDLAREVILRDS